MIKSSEEYKKKIALLKKYDELYFEYNKPKISDAEYDLLKKELIDFEKKNIKFSFVSKKVGFIPSQKFTKVKHTEKCYH